MRLKRLFISIHFIQPEPIGIVRDLEHIEPNAPWFRPGVLSMYQQRLNVLSCMLWLGMDVRQNDVHISSLLEGQPIALFPFVLEDIETGIGIGHIHEAVAIHEDIR